MEELRHHYSNINKTCVTLGQQYAAVAKSHLLLSQQLEQLKARYETGILHIHIRPFLAVLYAMMVPIGYIISSRIFFCSL